MTETPSGKRLSAFLPSVLLLLAAYSSITSTEVLAVRGVFGTPNPIVICENLHDLDIFGLKCLEGIFANVLSKVVVLLGIGLFLLLLYGGFRYITAGGDEKAIDSAKKTLTTGFAGFGLSVALYFIFSVLLQSLTIDYLRFQIPCNERASAWAAAKGIPQICP